MTEAPLTEPALAAPPARALVDVDAWLDAASRDAIDLLVESVVEMAGFQVAAIGVVLEGRMVTVSAAGSDGVEETLRGSSAAVDAVGRLLAQGESWGRFRHVSHLQPALEEVPSWTPDLQPQPGADAWHPLDFCLAPLHDDGGDLIGLLSIDVPLDGRLPTPERRMLLNRYADQAERAVRMTLERAAMAERVRLSDAARRVVRVATSQPDLERALGDCRAPIIEGYRADFLAISVIESDVTPTMGSGHLRGAQGLRPIVRPLAERAWARQRTVLLTEGCVDDLGSAEERRVLIAFMARVGLGAALIVPVGAGSAWLGFLVLGRSEPAPVWSAEERSSALDVARDIGQAVLSTQTRAREVRLYEELQRLSTYKSELLSTVSHELKNPLGVISGHLELLDAAPELSTESQFSIAAMGRATRRVSRVVDDLLLLSRFDEPDASIVAAPVPLGPLVEGALEMVRLPAQQRNLRIDVDLPEQPVVCCGDADELDRVLTNLLSNAVKYTERDRAITVSVVDRGAEVELSVRDHGIGISAADQEHLFEEFFRSTNPRALAQPGTGLGLAICARIVARHRGRITVDSDLGVGSTFRVFLPALSA